MKITTKEKTILQDFIKGKISLRNAAKQLKCGTATVYVKGFHYFKNRL